MTSPILRRGLLCCVLVLIIAQFDVSHGQQPLWDRQLNDDEFEIDDGDQDEFDNFNVQTSFIDRSFTGSASFGCARVKTLLQTGTAVKDLSPEDIDVVATMGDAVATGLGLWPSAEIEFRGAVFTTGGDANVDGLPTVSNILMQFNPHLQGVSHGMGTVAQLPREQLNVARAGAETDTLVSQATELVERLSVLNATRVGEPLREQWAMIFITIGTEELCAKCDEPNIKILRRALHILRKGVRKALVVVVGPVHVAKSTQLTYNLLKPRCPCLNTISDHKLRQIQQRWKAAFLELEADFNEHATSTFEVLALPLLLISSRYPEQLFIAEKPLLNRRGHAYAAKWLWNRLITGPKYNASRVSLSEDAYYCPSLGCPYFRTQANLLSCTTTTLQDAARRKALNETRYKTVNPVTPNPRVDWMQTNLAWTVIVIVVLASISVCTLGSMVYCHGLKQTKGRFEQVQGV
uniref:Lipase_GDSL domain-containing protein n=1 Tax=Panagrellus redivivus TaxID=6233 RepID=A0A7E4VGT9_PANRE